MDMNLLVNKANDVASSAQSVVDASKSLAIQIQKAATLVSSEQLNDPAILLLTIFMLACFVGYYVVWHVTPALHSPLMAVTNAISSVIIVGALLAAGTSIASGFSTTLSLVAIFLASINIFGGFIVTQRMLQMFAHKKKK
jgi:NAD(P) transhydrogenase subunit alpha